MTAKNPLPEADLLKRAPADESQWPEFLLIQADVFNVNDELCSLLEADEENPVLVRGRLDRLPHGKHSCLRTRDALPALIEISSVVRWSYGQFDDGIIAFWAGGNAGWYEIRPSRIYRPIYAEMTEAIQVLYFLADLYSGKKIKQMKQVTVELVLAKYAEDPDHKCADTEAAAQVLQRHRYVLFDLMIKGKEDIKWTSTPIYEYLEQLLEGAGTEEASVTTPASTNLSDLDDVPARLASKGKSALRPRSSTAGKGAARGRSTVDEEGDIDMDNGDEAAATPLKRKSTAAKRGRPSKRRNASSQRYELLPAAEPEEELSIRLPVREAPSKAALQREELEVHVLEQPLPSFEPSPDGTWYCKFDGCSHKIFDAANPAVRPLIREHYQQHAHKFQEQLDIVYKEERPYLPVGNLAKWIRTMSAQNKAATAAKVEANAQSTWPKPIERRY